ncbi:hypothetical protein BOTBODRAFT_541926 [Botryobasidium botryosum FD-172 SS1]|uniref:Uncharacterized protein n=1 Tax=Botryobasidium botryosum (strain FD-172 SS1) TaxID=930990 RepID=A0A067N169_BOTB1|nr:hypothetical protein BOTBODRAFT_541926 [Botryobasidium botryosum FD-172 SS1]
MGRRPRSRVGNLGHYAKKRKIADSHDSNKESYPPASSHPPPAHTGDTINPPPSQPDCDRISITPASPPSQAQAPTECSPSEPVSNVINASSGASSNASPPTMMYKPPPTIEAATLALQDLKDILHPPRKSGAGYKDPKLDPYVRERLEKLRMFLWNYTDKDGDQKWMAASLRAAHAYEAGPWLAGRLRKWAHAFILDRSDIPKNLYKKRTASSP